MTVAEECSANQTIFHGCQMINCPSVSDQGARENQSVVFIPISIWWHGVFSPEKANDDVG